ncbi:MAG: outer membrane beta-barrel protein [Candidatus Zixiibacteriota bacterium]|nr:MAG: outer membrane beta-barrel protein [candidate division Zixibacteria bacterium]
MSRIIYATTVFVLVCAFSAFASVDFTHGGIRAGYVMPNDIDNTVGFGAEVGFGLPVPNLSFNLEGGYWSKSYEEDLMGTTWEAKFTDFNFGLSGKYEVPAVPNTFHPYLGAGIGYHMLTAESEILGITVSVDDNKFGAHFFGGFRVPFNPIVSAFVEARYTVVDPDYFGVWGGINYGFAK